jgi:hypothetical protein
VAREPRESPASQTLQKLLSSEVIRKLETEGVHRTEAYRYARGAVIPNAQRAAVIERVTEGWVPANQWTPFDVGSDGNGDEPREAVS